MKKYTYRKNRLIVNIITCVLMFGIASWYLIYYMNSYFTRFGMTGFLILFGFYVLDLMIKDYKYPLILGKNCIELSTYGVKRKINYSQIATIKHMGFSHFIFWDSLTIICKDGQKIGVESVYENYFELWNSIIDNAKKINPKVEIHDSIRKRMSGHDNQGTGQSGDGSVIDG